MTTDVRIAHQSFLVSAGKSTGLRSTLPDSLDGSVVSWYVGGTLTDIDDLTGATEVEGTADGDDTVWTLPAATDNTPVRMTVDDVPVSVGWMYPSELGATSVTSELTVSVADASFTVQIGTLVTSGATSAAGVEPVDGDIPAAPLAAALDVPLTIAAALWGASWSDFAVFAGWENLSSGLAYQGSSDQWVVVDTDAETVTVATAPAPGRLVVIGTVLDLGNPLVNLGPGQALVQAGGELVAPSDETAPVYWPVVPARVAAVESDLADLTGEVDDLSGTVSGLGDDVAEVSHLGERWIVDAMIARAALTDPPAAWLECGGDPNRFWSCPTTIPTPTTSMLVRTWSRFTVSVGAGVNEFYDFAEDYSESHDGLGAVDRFEIAARWDGQRLRHFWEHLEVGESLETSHTIDEAAGLASDLPIGAWHEKEIFVDFAAGEIQYRVRVDVGWDYEASDGTRWATTRVFEKGSPLTMQEAAGHDQWIGRAPHGVRFDVARVRRWDDGALVLDANAATGTPAAGTLTDSVLLDDEEDPAVWTASGDNVIVTP